MLHQTQIAPATPDLLGDLHPLIEQLGSADGLAALADASFLPLHQITTAEGLKLFLQNYHATILQPLELPAIQRAFNHASRNELRELLAYDNQLTGEPLHQSFATASQRVGQAQLQRLRPLRDHRLVQRYLTAVEQGQAHGWHTLVYGLTLSVYSLPLRQGLAGYARQTTRSFIQSAARTLSLSASDTAKILDDLSATFPAAIEALLAQTVIS